MPTLSSDTSNFNYISVKQTNPVSSGSNNVLGKLFQTSIFAKGKGNSVVFKIRAVLKFGIFFQSCIDLSSNCCKRNNFTLGKEYRCCKKLLCVIGIEYNLLLNVCKYCKGSVSA